MTISQGHWQGDAAINKLFVTFIDPKIRERGMPWRPGEWRRKVCAEVPEESGRKGAGGSGVHKSLFFLCVCVCGANVHTCARELVKARGQSWVPFFRPYLPCF